ncbi:MAG: hypothetical protein ACR2P6_11020 [Gammaproteobacteria bacterium]
MNKQLFTAISTPLASIFGSGFLVIVPILAGAVGLYSPLAMAVVCAVAFCVGGVIRFNIRHAEPILADNPPEATLSLERASDLALVLAYVISVCLYLHILSAFVLNGFGVDNILNEDLLTTTVIAIITVIGVTRGLDVLEQLELRSLLVTLVIIVLLVSGFAWYDFGVNSSATWQWPQPVSRTPWEIMTIVGGTLIVVQGFETSRYLGAQYPAELRIRSSRGSQIISTVVYIIFVSLAMPILHTLNGQYDDNSLITMTAAAAVILVTPLIIAAALSQFSAAVADTLAASGNLEELTHEHMKERYAYLLIGGGAIALTWSADTYEILALASRAFAFYYLLQCLVAISVSKSIPQRFGIGLVALILAFVTVFAVPAG